jgi:hypothetical protein
MLNRRRALTLNDIRKLSKLPHISMEVLSQEYPFEVSSVKKADTQYQMKHQAV